jgi:hypothetical protein
MEEEQHLLGGEEVEGPNSDDSTEGLALCILGGFYLQKDGRILGQPLGRIICILYISVVE